MADYVLMTREMYETIVEQHGKHIGRTLVHDWGEPHRVIAPTIEGGALGINVYRPSIAPPPMPDQKDLP
jgi:hypothetical protein